METLRTKLEKLVMLSGTPEFYEALSSIEKTYTSQEDKKEIHQFIREGFSEINKEIKEIEKEIDIKAQLAEISEIISLSYLARTYFGKTRAWLYQRINGNMVHGKKCSFTEEEIEKLNYAIKDISKKLGSLSLG
ncbi:DUF5053 domain-containing protein [Bacteroides ihuae]|uniref:DUF5053 domain-containing protein n=1 Tax=Bacteroides ihuae TaxID=1852362 RepID=UPI0008DA987B|nr:DUF5053 domain-containing protein [Bacteroides ihuae]